MRLAVEVALAAGVELHVVVGGLDPVDLVDVEEHARGRRP